MIAERSFGEVHFGSAALGNKARTRRLATLATQLPQHPGESKEQSRRRESRESRLWPDGTRDLPGDPRLVVVCDRGGDTFEELEHECRSGRRLVIRAQHNRRVLIGHEGPSRKQYLQST